MSAPKDSASNSEAIGTTTESVRGGVEGTDNAVSVDEAVMAGEGGVSADEVVVVGDEGADKAVAVDERETAGEDSTSVDEDVEAMVCKALRSRTWRAERKENVIVMSLRLL